MSVIQLILLKIKKHTVILTMMVLLISVSFARNVYPLKDDMNSCMKCHTDAKKIKSLYIPPKIEFKELEGEG